MRLGQLSDDLDEAEEPNLTPLIDIVFILLIFFLVTTTFAKELGIRVDRPESSSASAQATQLIRVAIGRQGRITVDAQPTAAFRVEAEVKARLGGETHPVLIVADKAVDAETIVRILDACRSAGARDVAIGVDEG